MKKYLNLTFYLFCLIIGVIMGSNHRAEASTVPTGGEQEKNYAKWVYDDVTHCLTISGTGESHDEEKTQSIEGEWVFNNNTLPCYDLSASKEVSFGKIRNKVREIVVEQGVTAISYAAFSKCINVKKITLPDSVETLDKYIFWRCESLTELRIPDSVTSIGEGCFSGCKSLKKLILGKNVKSIGDGSFCECRSLRKITVSPQNLDFITKNGCLYQQKQKILCFSYANSRKASIEKGTTQIGTCAFTHHDRLQEVKIPASVTVIGGGAFYRCNQLKKVTFAKKSKCREIQSYGWYYADDAGEYGCFEYCMKLEKIRFPESLRYVEDCCLNYCKSLKEIYFGKNFKGYPIDEKRYKEFKYEPIEIRNFRLDNSFIREDTALETVKISKKNPYFCNRDGLVYDKKMTLLYFCPKAKSAAKITIPKSVKQINHYAFYQCKKIRSVVVSGKKTKITATAFKKAENMVLYGKKNSKAQKYAKKHKLKFVTI